VIVAIGGDKGGGGKRSTTTARMKDREGGIHIILLSAPNTLCSSNAHILVSTLCPLSADLQYLKGTYFVPKRSSLLEGLSLFEPHPTLKRPEVFQPADKTSAGGLFRSVVSFVLLCFPGHLASLWLWRCLCVPRVFAMEAQLHRQAMRARPECSPEAVAACCGPGIKKYMAVRTIACCLCEYKEPGPNIR
jgi:hypothetical protein